MIVEAVTTAAKILLRLAIVSPLMFFSSSHRDCRDVNQASCARDATQMRDGLVGFQRSAPPLPPTSSSAKADDPVFHDASALSHRLGLLDARLRGHDSPLCN